MQEAVEKQSILENVDIGVGTWAWGDRLVWGFGRGYSIEDVHQAFDASIAAGIGLFDTAEVYGQGRSEQLLGEFLKTTNQQVEIATKFMPYPWRLTKGSLTRALKGSLQRLGVAQVDLYQIHQALPPVNVETWMAALLEWCTPGWRGKWVSPTMIEAGTSGPMMHLPVKGFTSPATRWSTA